MTTPETVATRYATSSAPSATLDWVVLPWSFVPAIKALLPWLCTAGQRAPLGGIQIEAHEDCTFLTATDGTAAITLEGPILLGQPESASAPVLGRAVLSREGIQAWLDACPHDAMEWSRWYTTPIALEPEQDNYPDVRKVVPTGLLHDGISASSVALSSALLSRVGVVLRKLSLTAGAGIPLIVQHTTPLSPVLLTGDINSKKNILTGVMVILMPLRID